ncbi:hypothetical protein COW38_02900, partial [Candidatus Collierbacteria bacterium CG17_big_fil_post_rev_8_21_14_2_50_45_7]
GVALGDHGLRGQTLDPGKRSGVGEAEVVGEQEDKGFVVGIGLKQHGACLRRQVFFPLVTEVVVVATFEVAQE